jgi:hypothetical protein
MTMLANGFILNEDLTVMSIIVSLKSLREREEEGAKGDRKKGKKIKIKIKIKIPPKTYTTNQLTTP